MPKKPLPRKEKKKPTGLAGGSLTDEVRRKTGIGGETDTQRVDRAIKSKVDFSAKEEAARKAATPAGEEFVPGRFQRGEGEKVVEEQPINFVESGEALLTDCVEVNR